MPDDPKIAGTKPDPLTHTLGFLLHDAARLLRKRFDQKARHLGLTRAQWQVLAHVARNEGLHQGALAEILELEPITLVRLIDRLEAAGMVERRAHATDRRLKLLHLTDKARPVLETMRALSRPRRSPISAPPASRAARACRRPRWCAGRCSRWARWSRSPSRSTSTSPAAAT